MQVIDKKKGTKATTVSASIARGTGMELPSSGQSSGQ